MKTLKSCSINQYLELSQNKEARRVVRFNFKRTKFKANKRFRSFYFQPDVINKTLSTLPIRHNLTESKSQLNPDFLLNLLWFY